MIEFKIKDVLPSYKIGDTVNIKGRKVIQTWYGLSSRNLSSHSFGDKKTYYIHDIKIEYTLKHRNVDYQILISTNKEMQSGVFGFSCGWVNIKDIELAKNNYCIY